MSNNYNWMKVYLAGYINNVVIEHCISWRKRIKEYYSILKPYPIIWLDPLDGEDLKKISLDGLKGSSPPQAIVHKDYKYVETCDLIVANMDTFGQNRPLTGTICELAWGWQLHKPIIMITDDYNYKNHPFLEYFASWIVPNVEDMLKTNVIGHFCNYT